MTNFFLNWITVTGLVCFAMTGTGLLIATIAFVVKINVNVISGKYDS